MVNFIRIITHINDMKVWEDLVSTQSIRKELHSWLIVLWWIITMSKVFHVLGMCGWADAGQRQAMLAVGLFRQLNVPALCGHTECICLAKRLFIRAWMSDTAAAEQHVPWRHREVRLKLLSTKQTMSCLFSFLTCLRVLIRLAHH